MSDSEKAFPPVPEDAWTHRMTSRYSFVTYRLGRETFWLSRLDLLSVNRYILKPEILGWRETANIKRKLNYVSSKRIRRLTSTCLLRFSFVLVWAWASFIACQRENKSLCFFFPQSEPDESWPGRLVHQGRANPQTELPGHSVCGAHHIVIRNGLAV